MSRARNTYMSWNFRRHFSFMVHTQAFDSEHIIHIYLNMWCAGLRDRKCSWIMQKIRHWDVLHDDNLHLNVVRITDCRAMKIDTYMQSDVIIVNLFSCFLYILLYNTLVLWSNKILLHCLNIIDIIKGFYILLWHGTLSHAVYCAI